MAILTEKEAGSWGATLATVQEQRARIAQLEAALLDRAAQARWYLREAEALCGDEEYVVDWDAAEDVYRATCVAQARAELVRVGLLPPQP